MYSLEELNQNLVKVWNQVYLNTELCEDYVRMILGEHKIMTQNNISKVETYAFTERILEEINTLSRIESPYKELIDSIWKANHVISWYPNTTFIDPEIAINNENYCANLIGKKRDMQKNPYLFHSDKIIGGLFLMGKNQFYPEHSHPACETWVVLSGNCKWKLDDKEWRFRNPGEHFTFTENQTHSMKTQNEPLLALWAWTGDLSCWAKWD